MKVYLGSDHQGYQLKQAIFAWLSKEGIDVEDVGDTVPDPKDDYPQFAQMAALKLLGSEDKNARAILICGGGQGMAMAANRFRGIRAAVAWDEDEAKMSRLDNDSNVLSLPARILEGDFNNVKDVINVWLNTKFSGASRHTRRIQEIDDF
ncbi:RpiB/LacA/LacB family sugar-phosphate isomerase [Candidatus Saccharibacteria bacterium]|nr:RpiB/LacA/LacB family sugar-phosphate isomerase [Candidatus Saccharibacteria bacterium]